MKSIARLAKRIIGAVVPSKYTSKFDRLSEENQRTVTSNHPRSGL